MSIFSFFAKSNKKNKTTDDAIRDLEPGRSSIASEDDWDGMINTAMFGSSQAKGFFPFELIDAITRLSIINPDLSMAVRNISLLGNTGHTVEIYADESVADAFSEELKIAAAKIFSEGAGIDGFINTLFGQLARTGALSAEWVINETVDDIEDAVCVPVKSIRFLRKDGVYVPAQYISVMKDGKQYIELNPVSYSYYASDRVEDSPYAIPPMIAALSNIPIQKNIMEQLRFVARKSGLMGFLEVLVSAPMKKKNESEEQYKSRCREHIQAVAEKVKGSYNDGFMVAFKDLYEIKNTPVAGNAAGVYQLHQMNEEQIASGMGQDPAMLGRTYSTTETYAGVVMEKMLSQISNYQRLIKRFIEKGYKLKAALKGYNIDGLSIKFNSSDLEKKMEKAQALTVEIQNANLLYDAGIIDQNQRAQRLGFSSPALPGSRIEMTPPEIEQQAQIRQYRSKPAVILQTNRDGGYEIVEQIRRNF